MVEDAPKGDAPKKAVAKKDPEAALKKKYFQALFEGAPQDKPWGGLSEPARREVQNEYNKRLAEETL